MDAAVLDAPREVWRTDGPIASRRCVLSAGRHTVWEMPRPGGPLDVAVVEAAALLPALANRLAPLAPRLTFPDLDLCADRGVLRYEVPGSQLLAASLGVRDIPAGIAAGLGRLLAAIHATSPRDTGRDRPPIAPLADGLDPAGADGALHAALLGSDLLARARLARTDARQVLVHGRWSVGSVLLGPGGWTTLSGAEFWVGPPAHDLGYMLGELAEMAAAGTLADDRGLFAIALRTGLEMVLAYAGSEPVDADAVIAWTAHRTAAHLVLNAIWRREQAQPLPARAEWATTIGAIEGAIDRFERVLR